MKTCSLCGAVKEETEFARQRSSRRAYCKPCGVRLTTEWQKRNPEKTKANGRKTMRRKRACDPDWARQQRIVYKARNPDYWRRSKPREPAKLRAKLLVRSAILRGEIIRPGRCSACGVECVPDAHHPDYSRPLAIEWLCKKCHGLTWRLEARTAQPASHNLAST